ncbi:disease resistance protein (TIR-NBS-LRR class) [Trifolium pratense]|uniref:Disease resistance protein (TIR-NBS-LRR class) n=1 Tax=Trifolium pratense TaxID=57577 RepID=A0A2K3PPP7_TRIPR|nr:disease resistance protein (TIR-NBS-LRR class) [Trifolium pratense]
MHDLLQEMGRDIVNQESIDPGKRSRLWKAEEISDVLKKNKGTEAVEVITFDSTEVEDLYLKSDSFRKMTNLRYLKIYNASDGSTCNVYFPDGLEWLSDKLRYLCWEGYCLEYLPSTFCAEMLVELDMRNSKLKKLWDGVQNLVNLISIVFSFSKDLIEIPDLSRATNLQYIYLNECESLCQLHPSILSLPRLGELDLGGCIKLQSLKTNIHSTSLRKLFLTVCSSLTEFSVTSEEMTHLYLCGTAIHELSSSIWRNSKLVFLDLSECNKLNIVGNKLSNDHGLGSVTELDLSGCSEIDALSLRFILDGLQSLNQLKLKRCCNLECLPDNIQNHSMLKWLELDDCKKLVSLTELPPSVLYLSAVNCTYLDTDFTQQSIIENMIQTRFKDGIEGFLFLPGAQVPCMFDFQKMEASITISPIPKSDLHAFIFCIILSEGFNLNNYDLHCIIFEHDKEVDRCLQDNEEKLRWSTEWIKGCGVSPLYICERELEMDGGSKIVDLKLKSKAQDFAESDWHLKKDIDELQTRSIEGSLKAKQKSSKSFLSGHALEGCFQPHKCVPIKDLFNKEFVFEIIVDFLYMPKFHCLHSLCAVVSGSSPAYIRPVLASYQGCEIQDEFIRHSKDHQR